MGDRCERPRRTGYTGDVAGIGVPRMVSVFGNRGIVDNQICNNVRPERIVG